MAGCNDVHAADRRYALQIMKRVFGYAASVDTVGLKAQESYAYLKYDIRTNRRNCLLLAIPTMYAIANTGVREHVGETYDRVIMKRPGDMRLTQMLERNTIPYGISLRLSTTNCLSTAVSFRLSICATAASTAIR